MSYFLNPLSFVMHSEIQSLRAGEFTTSRILFSHLEGNQNHSLDVIIFESRC